MLLPLMLAENWAKDPPQRSNDNDMRIIFFISLFLVIFSFLNASSCLANESSLFENSLKKTAVGLGYVSSMDVVGGSDTLEQKIGGIVQIALSFLGVIFFILMIYGGFLWMTASGNEQQVDKARNLITAAIIGLVIVVAAYAISYFVVKTLGEKVLIKP